MHEHMDATFPPHINYSSSLNENQIKTTKFKNKITSEGKGNLLDHGSGGYHCRTNKHWSTKGGGERRL